MSFDPNAPHGNAPGSQTTPIDFNAMLARSIQTQEEGSSANGPPPTSGYEGVYNQVSTGPPDAPNLGPASGPPQQVLPADLPPQAFLTSAMILDFIDKKIVVTLRDDKTFVGILRSYDQFANLVLTEASERLFAVNPEFGHNDSARRWLIFDSHVGVMTVRGENVAVAGVVDLDREDDMKDCIRAHENVVRELLKTQRKQKGDETARKNRLFKKAGLEPDLGMEG